MAGLPAQDLVDGIERFGSMSERIAGFRPSARVERVAHRGSPRERRENTLEGFLLAVDHGADAIELDVHCSSDRQVVVFHDFSVAGLTVADSPWGALARLDLGGGARIPRLADVLTALGDRVMVYIELKGDRIEQDVLDIATRHGRRFALHSFDHDAIARVATLAPDVRRGVLLDRGLPDAPAALRDSIARTGATDVWPHWTLVDADLTGLAREYGARVITWTVNTRDVAEAVLKAGVDGICTDDVRLLAPFAS
jgi:glycerophosphoryl diester phosphodiesterase